MTYQSINPFDGKILRTFKERRDPALNDVLWKLNTLTCSSGKSCPALRDKSSSVVAEQRANSDGRRL